MGVWRRLAAGLTGLVLLATGTLAGCDWAEDTRFVHPVFEEIEATRDVLYRTAIGHDGQPVELRLNIYQPRGDARDERPVMMWMFGGAWQWGDRNQLALYAEDSARRGYVGVTIDYRVRPEGGPLLEVARDAYDDAVAAVAWLKDHAGEYRLDPDAIVAGGVSAGAVNAMNLLYTRDWGLDASPIAGGVSISGTSFAPPHAGDPPAIMHHGTADTTAPYAAARQTCDNAIAVGSGCEWMEYQGGDHFIVISNAAEIMETTADRIFERVLWPLGYRPEPAHP
jgi:acetyl esterase/lipase